MSLPRIDALEERRLLTTTVATVGSPVPIVTIPLTSAPFAAPFAACAVGPAGSGDVFLAYIKSGVVDGVILDSSNNILVPEFPIGQNADPGGSIVAAQDTQGNAVIVYQTAIFNDFELQIARIGATGQLVDAPTPLTVFGSLNTEPALAIGPDDSAAVVYEQGTSDSTIQARVVDANDSPLIPTTQVSPAFTGTGAQYLTDPVVAFDPSSGNFLAVWHEEDIDTGAIATNSIQDRTFTAAGILGLDPQLAKLGTGAEPLSGILSFFVTGNENPFGVLYAQKVTSGGGLFAVQAGSDGTPVGSPTTIAPASSDVSLPFDVQEIVNNEILLLSYNATPLDSGALITGTSYAVVNPETGGLTVVTDPSALSTGVSSAPPAAVSTGPLFIDLINATTTGNSLTISAQPLQVTPDTTTTTPPTQPPPTQPPPVSVTPETTVASAGDPGTITDGAGTIAIFSVKGKGKGTAKRNADGTFNINITGANGQSIFSVSSASSSPKLVHRSDTTASSDVQITTITASSPIGTFNAPGADVTGNITLKGISSLTLANLTGQKLNLGSVTSAVIKLGHVSTTQLTAVGSIKTLSATDWTGGSITATSIASLSTVGDFDANLSVTSAAKLTIGGVLGGTTTTDIRSLRAKQSFGVIAAARIANADIFAGVKPTLAALLKARSAFISPKASITSLIAHGFTDAIIAAPIITTLKIHGLTPASPTAFGIAAERITSYLRDTVIAKNIFSKKTIDSDGEYIARTV